MTEGEKKRNVGDGVLDGLQQKSFRFFLAENFGRLNSRRVTLLSVLNKKRTLFIQKKFLQYCLKFDTIIYVGKLSAKGLSYSASF